MENGTKKKEKKKKEIKINVNGFLSKSAYFLWIANFNRFVGHLCELSFPGSKSLLVRFNMSQPFEFFGCYIISHRKGSYTYIATSQIERGKKKKPWGYIYIWLGKSLLLKFGQVS